ncbi:MAG TPA: hypothetical protein VMM92_00225 [Thermoanaerobaculia bacterium]|nr:hypothetical protein [Thermoanaerobaculia bacterium]
MDTLEKLTTEAAGYWSLGPRLQGLKRGLALIERTRSRDDRRVMLGCVVKELNALRGEAAAAPPHIFESLAAIEAGALAWRAKLGAPVSPDEDPGTKPARRRRRKESHHGLPARWNEHPDAHDGTPAAQVVSSERPG